MRTRRVLVLALLVGALLTRAIGTAEASGLTPEKKGWWSASGAPVPTLVPGRGGTTSAAPDVPDGGLYVDGSASNPFAVSALRYLLPRGTTATSLSLTVAPNSVMVPGTKVRACPLTGSRNFESTQGGALTSAPPSDCAHAVDGVADPSGVAFSFAIAPLVVDDVLAVAIVPAGSDDRVAFAAPDPTSLPLVEQSSPTGAPPTTSATARVPQPVGPSPSVSAPPIGARPAATAAPATATGAPESAPARAAANTPAAAIGIAAAGGHGASNALVGAIGVAVLAVAVWWRGRKMLNMAIVAQRSRG